MVLPGQERGATVGVKKIHPLTFSSALKHHPNFVPEDIWARAFNNSRKAWLELQDVFPTLSSYIHARLSPASSQGHCPQTSLKICHPRVSELSILIVNHFNMKLCPGSQLRHTFYKMEALIWIQILKALRKFLSRVHIYLTLHIGNIQELLISKQHHLNKWYIKKIKFC